MALTKISTGVIKDSSITAPKIGANAVVDANLGSPLSTRLNVPFIRKQVVHRRPFYGVGTMWSTSGDVYRNDSTILATPYGPFSYGVPAVQAGAERRFRLYVVWSDGSQNQGDVQLLFRPNDSATNQVVFTLGSTWGGAGTSNRDGYSNEIVGTPWGDHGYIRASGTGSTNYIMRFHYIELQALDVWL